MGSLFIRLEIEAWRKKKSIEEKKFVLVPKVFLLSRIFDGFDWAYSRASEP